jgi:purine nucleoside phosphorylase
MNGIIGGTSLLNSSAFESWEETRIETPYGETHARIRGNDVFVQRHGDPPLPPHLVNHKANIWALEHLAVRRIVSINSVGSLKTDLRPGTFLIPDDFISLWSIPTFFDKEMKFIVPVMHEGLQLHLHKLCMEIGLKIRLGGVYIQTTGPRLETRAEVRLLKKFGDIVGMTMASEATLCLEREIPYASLCSVDNYCHGIARVPLTMEQINDNCRKNQEQIDRLVPLMLQGDYK